MLNKVQIIGRLGRDPELRYTSSGVAVVNVSVATTEKWKDKNSGQIQEKTEWHRCTAYERQAEVIGEYLKKGSLAYFEGKLETRKFQDKNGNDQTSTEIRVERMVMLGDKGERQEAPAPAAAPRSAPQRQAPAPKPAPGNFDDLDDDIPF